MVTAAAMAAVSTLAGREWAMAEGRRWAVVEREVVVIAAADMETAEMDMATVAVAVGD